MRVPLFAATLSYSSVLSFFGCAVSITNGRCLSADRKSGRARSRSLECFSGPWRKWRTISAAVLRIVDFRWFPAGDRYPDFSPATRCLAADRLASGIRRGTRKRCVSFSTAMNVSKIVRTCLERSTTLSGLFYCILNHIQFHNGPVFLTIPYFRKVKFIRFWRFFFDYILSLYLLHGFLLHESIYESSKLCIQIIRWTSQIFPLGKPLCPSKYFRDPRYRCIIYKLGIRIKTFAENKS